MVTVCHNQKFRPGILVKFKSELSFSRIRFGEICLVIEILDYDEMLGMNWIAVLHEGQRYHQLTGDFDVIEES